MYVSQPLFATIGEGPEIVLIVLMTPPYKLQILSPHSAREEAFEILATELCERRWPVPAVVAEREIGASFADPWTRITGQQSRLGMQQRIYELREVKHTDYPRGAFKQATSDDLGLAKQWAKSFQDAWPQERVRRRTAKPSVLYKLLRGTGETDTQRLLSRGFLSSSSMTERNFVPFIPT